MSLSDLETVGYTVIPNFLSAFELQMFKNEYIKSKSSPNKNYALKQSAIAIRLLGDRVMNIAKEVSLETSIKTDIFMEVVNYTDTGNINFSWHQDHESQFVFQQSFNHLNFYIPIIKPEITQSGLSVVPMNILSDRIGTTVKNYIGSGAKRFFPHGKQTRVYDDETGENYDIPVNLDEISYTPALAAGDLLLLRGDVIHKTQDIDTRRVALSIRTVEDSVIEKTKLFSGCAEKMSYIENNKKYYNALAKLFEEKQSDTIKASDIHIKFD